MPGIPKNNTIGKIEVLIFDRVTTKTHYVTEITPLIMIHNTLSYWGSAIWHQFVRKALWRTVSYWKNTLFATATLLPLQAAVMHDLLQEKHRFEHKKNQYNYAKLW